jgi:predicted glycoside hydrolase/deacetylase ChbG (UPF0249 family)
MMHSVNRAIFEALEKGWATSASIMVPCPWFPEVTRWAKSHPDADLGLHLTLDSEWTDLRWGPVASTDKVHSLLDAQGYLPDDPDKLHARKKEIERELRAQIARAQAFGIQATHFDSHMLALMNSKEFFKLYDKLGRDYHVPIRLARAGDELPPQGTKIPDDEIVLDSIISMPPGVSKENWAKWYEDKLAALGPGVYLMVVHLAHDDEEMQGATWNHPDWGAAWRQQDFDTVQSPEFRGFLQTHGFTLVSWKQLNERFQQNRGH